MCMELNGSAAVVTGGASGLGLATTRSLVETGMQVLVIDTNSQRFDQVRTEFGSKVVFESCDVTDSASVGEAIRSISDSLPLRVAVNCAGIGIAKRVLARDGSPHDSESFERVIRVNLVGTFNVLAAAASIMAGNEPGDEDGQRGVIVNTASIAAFDGQIGQIAYSASKGGIVGMTLPAARDLSVHGIRVVAIAPGIIDTPLLGMLPAEVRTALGQGVPFPKRLGLPEDFAQLVLAVVKNRYLNGEVIRLDGALRMPPK